MQIFILKLFRNKTLFSVHTQSWNKNLSKINCSTNCGKFIKTLKRKIEGLIKITYDYFCLTSIASIDFFESLKMFAQYISSTEN